MKKVMFLTSILITLVLISAVANAGPSLMNYQGNVNVQGTPFSGTGYFRFAIVDSTEAVLWSNDGSSPPVTDVLVSVEDGLFNVVLGEGMNPITGSVFENSILYLRIWFGDSSGTIQLLKPDQRITSHGYAFQADNADYLNSESGAYYLDWSNFLNVPPEIADGTDDDQPDTDGEVPDAISINNGGLYSMNGSGHVGIGTTTPGAALDVNGDIHVASGSFLYLDDSAGENYVRQISEGLSMHGSPGTLIEGNEYFSVSVNSASDVIYIDEYGIVSIGIGNTYAGLIVDGKVTSLQGGFKFPDASIQTSAAVGDGHSLDAVDGEPADMVYVDAEGQVGIGTLVPDSGLDVRVSNGTSESAIYGENSISEGIAVYGLANNDTPGSSGIGVFGRTNGDNKAAGIYGVASSTTGSSRAIWGDAKSSSGYSGYFTGGRNYFEGNVGIGEYNPSEKLHVDGNILISAPNGIVFGADEAQIHHSSQNLHLEADSDVFIQSGNDIRIADDLLFVDGVEDRIGIGTNTPGTTLDVAGDVCTSGDYTYPTPRTHYLQIPACEFTIATNHSGTLTWSLDYMYLESGSEAHLVAPINLPDNADINAVRVYYFDDSESNGMNIYAKIFDRTMSDPSPTMPVDIEILDTGNSELVQFEELSGIDMGLIDNENHRYLIQFSWLVLTPESSQKVYGCRIEYTLSAVSH